MQEIDAKQKNLEAALGQAQSNSVNAFNEMVNKLNSPPQDRAQGLVNYQNMLVNEMNGKIASEMNAADYIDADIMMNNGRIGWKTSDKDAAEAQRYNDARAVDKQKVLDLVNADQDRLSQLNSTRPSQEREQADIQSTLQFMVDFYTQVFKKYGEKTKTAAEDLANKAKGKWIRSAGEAIRHFLKNCESLALSLVVKCAQYFHRTGYPSDIDLNFLNKTAFTGNAIEIAKQHHCKLHNRVDSGPSIVMVIKMGHFATDEIEIDSGVDFSHQMIFKYQLFKGDHFDLILLRGKIL